MSWDVTMVTMLRVLINDLVEPYTYSDARCDQLLVVGATYVQQEIYFATTYTIDINTPDISPDPTLDATKDQPFTNFTVLKAACLADVSTYRTEALRAGIEARVGPAILKTKDRMIGFDTLLKKGPCEAYKELKAEYEFGDALAIHAIFSPFSGNNFNPHNLRTSVHSSHDCPRGGVII